MEQNLQREVTVGRNAVSAPGFARAPTGDPSLAQTVRTFFRNPSPCLLSIALMVALVVRARMAQWTPWDAVLALGLIAFQPLNEWLIHSYILHFRPRTFGPFTLDFRLAKTHRAHHMNPWDVPTLFIPLWAIGAALVVEPLLFYVLLPTTALAATGLTTALAIGVFYEWSHYLPHTAYRPKSSWWRNVVKYHRLHHFKNERYWMGVSSNLGDMLLQTFPQPREVAHSATVRDILARGDCTPGGMTSE